MNKFEIICGVILIFYSINRIETRNLLNYKNSSLKHHTIIKNNVINKTDLNSCEKIKVLAKKYLFHIINENYMFICVMSSTYLFVIFLFFITCVTFYWDTISNST